MAEHITQAELDELQRQLDELKQFVVKEEQIIPEPPAPIFIRPVVLAPNQPTPIEVKPEVKAINCCLQDEKVIKEKFDSTLFKQILTTKSLKGALLAIPFIFAVSNSLWLRSGVVLYGIFIIYFFIIKKGS